LSISLTRGDLCEISLVVKNIRSSVYPKIRDDRRSPVMMTRTEYHDGLGNRK
jgi:hypothetical protein